MSKNSLIFLVVVISLFAISLFVILRSGPSFLPSPTAVTFATQENSGGDVDVTVTPKTLVLGQRPRFKLEFNTHSVELDFDISQVTTLTDENGDTYTPPIWDGSPPGGHHREGILTFGQNLKEIKSVTLSLSNISYVAKREFTWQL